MFQQKYQVTLLSLILSTVFIGCPDNTTIPPPHASQPPAKPENLEAFFLSSSTIRLEWDDLSENEDEFHLYKSVNNDSVFFAAAAANQNWISMDLEDNNIDSTYYFKLQAVNTAGKSEFSNTAKALAGTLLRSMERQSSPALSVAFHPDGETVASGWTTRRIIIWNSVTRDKLNVIEGHGGAVTALQYSANGDILASSSYDGLVKLWNASDYSLNRNLEGHESRVDDLDIDPVSGFIASVSTDSTIRIWNPENGENTLTIKDSTRVESVAWSIDGSIIAAGVNFNIHIYDAETGERITIIEGHGGKVKSLSFSPDGETLASGSQDRTIQIHEVGDDWSPLETYTAHNASINVVNYSANGIYLASGANDPDHTLRVQTLGEQDEVRQMEGHASSIFDLDFSPDGHYIASASEDRYIRIWGYFK